ncbi:MAG: cell division protein FtsH [Candidatus Lambdaproteobacteria bacterium RIFOXYD1_FULL_56_27]|uniref:ATP-dependent zinc metalloprotease FtsH n=1 Tax=Candidatus Lambdaproteobacteria bacterium RIFOXYD2_FULL_56_26 TaxID=1817773 RepID=A0A1F6GVS1_9PROT|nr:MAG: cell division protein FtsH [Candidatus Lambdaproteobacteria bacterium RIFOXYD2_FULL_56_26]OGH03284.1 MAG: cell division protein FtsH [Candidatus Lambdaproteobacteria bacterium RIFOXYC1_FULL_56_13]OGH07482.1 MAG: cell division protein FtsH [Candidatus Lambdaproteobacteria bacterium RIFOXYD1_FULL_56_27]
MQPTPKNLILILALVLGFVLVYAISSAPGKGKDVPFSAFLNLVDAGQVTDVILKGTSVTGRTQAQEVFTTTIPRYFAVVPLLHEKRVHFRIESGESSNLFFAILSSWLPIILIIGVWVFFMRQMQGGNKVMGFGKSKPKKTDENTVKVTFADVAGIDESKAELDEIVEFLKDPSKFEKLGGRIPTGVLLVGEPGTGKTLLAKAIAGEAGVAFFSISGSDFVEMFVGVGASRVRDLFAQARAAAPCIIFIDEIDAVGRHRGAGLGGGNDEREQTLNQLLVEMDGFNGNEGVIVVAATNRPDVLDSALTRPGRFDRQVTVPKPDLAGRQRILQVHTKGITLDKDVDLKVVAQATPGFTGADLANLANESALAAARKNQATVCMADFEEARDKLMMGKERRSMVIPDKEKRTTAFHEAGHALVAALTPGVDPVHKVTIVPRGRALGLTMLLPTEDRYSQHRSQLVGMLSMMMGGRAAEEIIFNHFTTGASNDLERATQVAHKMVCNWGMSERVGPVYLAVGQGEVFLGRDLMKKKRISQSSARLIDQEVKRIVNDAYQQAKSLLQSHLEQLNLVTERLIERETIDGSYILEVLGKPAPA